MKELICIVCPKGCRLQVDDQNNYTVRGNQCERGALYGKNEVLNPVRTLTSTVKIQGALYSRCPVKTDKPIRKDDLMRVMKALNSVTITSPVHVGDVVIQNAAESGADIVVTKSM